MTASRARREPTAPILPLFMMMSSSSPDWPRCVDRSASCTVTHTAHRHHLVSPPLDVVPCWVATMPFTVLRCGTWKHSQP